MSSQFIAHSSSSLFYHKIVAGSLDIFASPFTALGENAANICTALSGVTSRLYYRIAAISEINVKWHPQPADAA
jgi:hypothetical protein